MGEGDDNYKYKARKNVSQQRYIARWGKNGNLKSEIRIEFWILKSEFRFKTGKLWTRILYLFYALPIQQSYF